VEPLLEDLGEDLDLSGIDWVIVGGESGYGARAMEQMWVLNVLSACRRHRVPFFFKQWGGIQKKKSGRILLGRTYDEFPESRNAPFPPRAERLEAMGEVGRRFSALNGQKQTVPGKHT
jgi:protein gp37